MGALSVTQLYDSLSVKLGKETAENLTTFIELKIDRELESKLSMLATKDDLAKAVSALSSSINEYRRESKEDYARLELKLNEYRMESKDDYARLELKLSIEITRLEARIDKLEAHFDRRFNEFENRLLEKMAEYRFETIKWVIGLLVTLGTLLFLYLKMVI